MKPKFLHDKDPWVLAEDIPDSDIFFFQIPFSCFGQDQDSSYSFIKNYKKIIASFERFHMLFYFGEKDSYDVAESILKALVDRDDFGNDLNENIVVWSYKLIDFAKGVQKQDVKQLSNDELWNLYKEHDDVHTKLYTYGWLPVSVDMFHNNFTNYLKKYLLSLDSSQENVEKHFIVLTTPTERSILNQEQDEFLDIYSESKDFLKNYTKDTVIPEVIQQNLENHSKKWGHLGYIYAGNAPAFDENHYLKELVDLAKSGVNVVDLKNKTQQQFEKTKKEQERIIAGIKIDDKHQKLLETAVQFALTKLIRRDAQLFDLFVMHKYLLSEISLRLDLTRYQVQFMLKDEVKDALVEGKCDKSICERRLKSCVYYTEDSFEGVYIGETDNELKKELTTVIDQDVEELRGQSANPGSAKGVVKIIIRARDMDKMQDGDILVSIATDPDIVPAMKKAAAIVTEQGGITSHAAIVSRELGIPCVIGTKIATKVLKDGDMVEVDAEKGIVRKIVQ